MPKHPIKKILITGAAGFIGFHLSLFLKKRNDQVFGLDNFNNYYNPKLKYMRAQVLKEHEIEVIEGDICDQTLLEDLLEKQKITHVVHLAAQAGVRRSLTHPQEYVKNNLQGFVSLLEALKKHPSVKLTYASSSSVYGSCMKIPFKESDPLQIPSNIYGITKQTNEQMATNYHSLYGISVTGLRFFTVYGPWGRPDMAYFKFTDHILQKKPIDIFYLGKMQRDFTYIDDIVQGTAQAIDLESECEIFNLGNHKPVFLLDFIHVLESHIGKSAQKNFLSSSKGEALITFADISKAQKILNFSPKTNIETGLQKFIQWYKTIQL